MFVNNIKRTLAALAFFGFSQASYAAPIVLNFEGVGNFAAVNDFYNGGTDSAGHSGTNYGINFSTTSLGLIDVDAGGSGNFGLEPSPDTVLFFLSGGAATMNLAAGFDTGFSFFYSSVSFNGSVNVYDGLNATGNILATLDLKANGFGPGDPNGAFSNWTAVGVTFAGIAKSVDFGGVANQIAFDNVTLGSATAGGNNVPEPASLLLMSMGAIGVAAKRRRKIVNKA